MAAPPLKRARTVAPTPSCRYCFSDELSADDEFITPCACRGDQTYCHLSCLRRWQRSLIVTQPTHPSLYEEDVRRCICRVCTQPFSPPPLSREVMYRSFSGPELAELVAVGCLIVAERSSSAEMEHVVEHNSHLEEVRSMRHWIRAVMCITSVTSAEEAGGGAGQDGISAVNLSRRIEIEAPLDVLAMLGFDLVPPSVTLRHFAGGPCDSVSPAIAMGSLICTTEEGGELLRLQEEKDVRRVGGTHGALWVTGDVHSVAEAVAADRATLRARRALQAPPPGAEPGTVAAKEDEGDAPVDAVGVAEEVVLVFWGYAGWSRTQLHGELARGGWGMCRAELTDIFTPLVAARPGLGLLSSRWDRVVDSGRLVYAAENEMSTTRTAAEGEGRREVEEAAQADGVRAVAQELARQQSDLRAQRLARQQQDQHAIEASPDGRGGTGDNAAPLAAPVAGTPIHATRGGGAALFASAFALRGNGGGAANVHVGIGGLDGGALARELAGVEGGDEVLATLGELTGL